MSFTLVITLSYAALLFFGDLSSRGALLTFTVLALSTGMVFSVSTMSEGKMMVITTTAVLLAYLLLPLVAAVLSGELGRLFVGSSGGKVGNIGPLVGILGVILLVALGLLATAVFSFLTLSGFLMGRSLQARMSQTLSATKGADAASRLGSVATVGAAAVGAVATIVGALLTR